MPNQGRAGGSEPVIDTDAQEKPRQRSGFVLSARCSTCGWPHITRGVKRRGFRRVTETFYDECGNCGQRVEVWHGRA